MSIREWAQREIDIAKDRDRKIEEATDTEWDNGRPNKGAQYVVLEDGEK